jgi:hypothetical protein
VQLRKGAFFLRLSSAASFSTLFGTGHLLLHKAASKLLLIPDVTRAVDCVAAAVRLVANRQQGEWVFPSDSGCVWLY